MRNGRLDFSGGSCGEALELVIEEICGFMKRGTFTIASHMTELAEERLTITATRTTRSCRCATT